MSKKALLVNPWVTDFKLYDEWMHPVGLYFLISLLGHNGWDLQYTSCLERNPETKAKRNSTGAFPDKVISKPTVFHTIDRRYKRYGILKDLFRWRLKNLEKPDIIFLGTGMTYWFDGIIETYYEIKDVFPNIPVIVGGIAATLIPDILERNLSGATIYRGPLSTTISNLPKMQDITFKGWEPSITGALKLQTNHYHGVILTSLGCPFRCSYCASSHLQKSFQFRTHDTVLQEITFAVETRNITDFAFYDDALLYQPEKNFLPLARKLRALGTDLKLHTPNGLHIRWLNRKILDAMVSCGFHTLRFGYETSNEKFINATSSKTSRQQLKEKIKLVDQAGFQAKQTGIYIMAGLPEQTVEDVLDELAFISSLGVLVKPVFLSPVPHTPLFAHYAKQFPLLQTDPHYHNDTFFITQLPGWDYAAVEEIKQKAREMNNRIYNESA